MLLLKASSNTKVQLFGFTQNVLTPGVPHSYLFSLALGGLN